MGSAVPSRSRQAEVMDSVVPSQALRAGVMDSVVPSRTRKAEAMGRATPSRALKAEAMGSAVPSRARKAEQGQGSRSCRINAVAARAGWTRIGWRSRRSDPHHCARSVTQCGRCRVQSKIRGSPSKRRPNSSKTFLAFELLRGR